MTVYYVTGSQVPVVDPTPCIGPIETLDAARKVCGKGMLLYRAPDRFAWMSQWVEIPNAASGSEARTDMNRLSWDEYFMEIAYTTAKRATCPKRSVGAVIVQGCRIIATGYNGAPAGTSHCPTSDPEGHPDCIEHGHCVRTIHAEMNAIIACAAAGVSATGGTLYSTAFPCPRCMGALINAGIKHIVYAESYSKMDISAALAAEVGMEIKELCRTPKRAQTSESPSEAKRAKTETTPPDTERATDQ